MDEAVVLDNGAYEIKYCHKDKQGCGIQAYSSFIDAS